MKILLVHNLYKVHAGENTAFYADKKLLEDNGHIVVPFIKDNQDIDKFSFTKKAALLYQTTWSASIYAELKELLERENPDVAHFHNTLPLITPSAYYACRDSGVPIVQTLHNFRLFCPVATFYRNTSICEDCLSKSLWQSIRFGCYRDSHIQSAVVAAMLKYHWHKRTYQDVIGRYIVFNNFQRDKFSRNGIPAEKIVIKPNFLVSTALQQSEIKDHILFIGRLDNGKGAQILIKAATHFPDHKINIVGEGPERAGLETMAAQKGLKNIKFWGHCSSEVCFELLRSAQCFVLPSLWYEGMPLVALEAFAAGVPVVVSRVGGLPDLIREGESGFCFEPGNHQDLARVLKNILGNKSLQEKLYVGARAEYEHNYTPERNIRKLESVYAYLFKNR